MWNTCAFLNVKDYVNIEGPPATFNITLKVMLDGNDKYVP